MTAVMPMPPMTRFQAEVCNALWSIPKGEVRTYGQVAEMIGRSRGSSQAVAGAVRYLGEEDCAPWWKVVKGDGSLIEPHTVEQRDELARDGFRLKSNGRAF